MLVSLSISLGSIPVCLSHLLKLIKAFNLQNILLHAVNHLKDLPNPFVVFVYI